MMMPVTTVTAVVSPAPTIANPPIPTVLQLECQKAARGIVHLEAA
jgi:hypothetical protein